MAIVLLQKAGILMNNYYLAIGFAMAVMWMALVFPLTRNRDAETESSGTDQ